MSSIFVPLVKKYRTSREKVSYLSWKSIVPLTKKKPEKSHFLTPSNQGSNQENNQVCNQAINQGRTGFAGMMMTFQQSKKHRKIAKNSIEAYNYGDVNIFSVIAYNHLRNCL